MEKNEREGRWAAKTLDRGLVAVAARTTVPAPRDEIVAGLDVFRNHDLVDDREVVVLVSGAAGVVLPAGRVVAIAEAEEADALPGTNCLQVLITFAYGCMACSCKQIVGISIAPRMADSCFFTCPFSSGSGYC